LSVREGSQRKQVHLAVEAGAGQLDFDSLVQLSEVAERGLFDFLLLPEGSLTVLAALTGVTDHLGLVGTADTASTEPFLLARQFATLDHLCGGRVGWHLSSATHADGRAAEFTTVARAFWNSWAPDAVLADIDSGIYADPDRIRPVDHTGPHFDVHGLATLPAGPQGAPVLLTSDSGAEYADVLLTPHPAHGRKSDQLLVLSPAPRFAGTADQIARQLDELVQSDACDGFLLTPHGLDEFVDSVVPLLQERGAFRTEYRGRTLRENLGL
jgi:alkanesulfonate monooxygenase SsuD/methylene tetrahydromethanopterin reductase-like flavin-dependent oxidoreductase (luciferase family)